MGREPFIRTMVEMHLSRPAAFSIVCALLLAGCTIPPIAPPAQPDQPSSATGSASSVEPVAPPAATGSAVIDERVLPSGMTEAGAESAPVSIVLFTNAACGYCRDFQEDLLPRVISEYVRTGKARLAISPFLVRKYAESETLALAQLCAARQGKGMAMQDLLFRERVGTAAYRAGLETLQIDQTQLAQCMEDLATRTTMETLQAMATASGITLVPSYVINGEMHVGLPEYADLRGAIEAALTASGRSR